MSEEHVGAERLHEYAEGLLAPEQAARVRTHLDACAACASEAEAIRGLRSDLARLSRTLDPGRDLRPGIRALRVRSLARRRTRLASAALVVVAAGMAALVLRGGLDAPAPTAAAPAEADGAVAMVLALDHEYEQAGDELKARVEGAGVSPGASAAARLVAGDLAAVERALAESRSALREDPASPIVRELVLAAHRQRLEVLRRAASLATETEEAS